MNAQGEERIGFGGMSDVRRTFRDAMAEPHKRRYPIRGVEGYTSLRRKPSHSCSQFNHPGRSCFLALIAATHRNPPGRRQAGWLMGTGEDKCSEPRFCPAE